MSGESIAPGGLGSTGLIKLCPDAKVITFELDEIRRNLALLKVGNPTGRIIAFAGATIPEGWLDCNGQAVSRAIYSNLFAVIRTTWGAGDGSLTFNVPDLRGCSPIGVGSGVGLTPRALAASVGAETHAQTSGTLGADSHPLTSNEVPATDVGIGAVDAVMDAGVGAVARNLAYIASVDGNHLTVQGGGEGHVHTVSGAPGDGSSMQPSRGVYFLIKI